jgi:hypothetical protein
MTEEPVTPVVISGRIRESDLDLVLLLDAAERGPASAFLAAEAGLTGELVGVERSAHRGTDGRETDVVLTFTDGEIHVEHKLDAELGDGQAESYALHRNSRQSAGDDGTKVICILVSPSRSLATHQSASEGCFDHYLSCAHLADAAAGEGPLGRAVALVYRKAEETRARPDENPELVEWGEQYRLVLAELSGDQALALSPGSLRRSYQAQFVRSPQMYLDVRRPDGVDDCYVWKFAHHVTAGRVQIELAPLLDVDPASLPERLELNPEGGLAAAPDREQCHVRVSVPPLDTAKPPAEQRDAIQGVVTAAVALRDWAHAYIEKNHQQTLGT